jgi:hypothetical protein
VEVANILMIGLELLFDTETGAATVPLRPALQISSVPAFCGLGAHCSDVSCKGCTLAVAVFKPSADAEIVTDDTVVEAATVGVNVPDDEPAGIVSVLGTMTDAELLDNVTTVPPTGAGLLTVTIHASVLAPATNVEGHESEDRVTDDGVGGTTVTDAL